jgi:hypothetical protein
MIINNLYKHYFYFEVFIIFFIFKNFEQRDLFFYYYLPFLVIKLSFNNEFYTDLVFKKKLSSNSILNNFYIPVTRVIFLTISFGFIFYMIIHSFFLNKTLFNFTYSSLFMISCTVANLFLFLVNYFLEKILVKINKKKFANINFIVIFFSFIFLLYNIIYELKNIIIIIFFIIFFLEFFKFLLYIFFFKNNLKNLSFKFKNKSFEDLRLSFFLKSAIMF